MAKTEKVQKVHELADRLRSSNGALFTDYRGLTVKDATEVRALLRQADSSFVVAKNTLTRLAATEAGIEGLQGVLTGPTGIAFTDGDPIAGAKAVLEAARRFPALQVKGAFIEGQVLDGERAQGLATIDAKEVSIAKVAGVLQSPLARMVYVLQAPLQRIAYALAERSRRLDETSAEPSHTRKEGES